ncbi:S1 domain-containing RNA-binding protein [Furfurilactobacillus siliginis]|nr:S1 domain-containing RNA-binding protein [Furfurilactobacillus siliginis]GEK28935.1 RNA-binding protein [Furfurilactobacillus siliginis]
MAVAVGDKVTGKVTGITNFGAFVDLGEHQSGLVHISQVSNEYVKDIHDVLHVGDEVTVKVLSMEKGKVGLSIKQATEQPQSAHHEQHTEHRPSSPRSAQGHNDHGHSSRPQRSGNRRDQPAEGGFDGMMASFLKDSEQRLATLKHNTEGKRGGRGGRRS